MVLFSQTVAGWWYTYPSEKYEFVNGKDDIAFLLWKIKAMFETTNQSCWDLFWTPKKDDRDRGFCQYGRLRMK
jgi:hypothetical protein